MSFFRRAVGFVSQALKAARPAGAGAIAGEGKPTRVIDTEVGKAAHATLRESIRVLSQGGGAGSATRPMTLPPASTLHEWNQTSLDLLAVDQLEVLARSEYEKAEGEQGAVGAIVAKVESPQKHLERAVELWREGASRGSIESTYSLAACLREGKGMANKEPKEAFELLKMLAEEHNYNLAHYALAMMFSSGEGIESKDDARAFVHFKAAAKGGILPALHNVANCYANGRGVKQSDHNALLYYNAGADAGDPSSKYTLATWLVKGTRGGVVKDEARAFQLQCEAAQMGHPAAAFNVGAHFMAGQGVEKDFTKAAEWFEKASEMGIIEAGMNLANMYRDGLGVPKDLLKSKALFEKYAGKNELAAALLMNVEEEIAHEKAQR